jgi:hypothetical protein
MIGYIPDGHVLPGDRLGRFTMAARLMNLYKPEYIFFDMDLWDLPSICKHSKPREVEGKRLKAEIEIGHDAVKTFDDALLYAPKRRIMQESNHVHRVERLLGERPELEGLFGLKESFSHPGWELHPYEAGHPCVLNVDGFNVAHYFAVGGREVGGKFPAQSILMDRRSNCLFGHTHRRGFASHTNGDGTLTRALNAGCFVSDHFKETAPYAADSKRHWAQGVLVVGPDWEDWWSLRRLKML